MVSPLHAVGQRVRESREVLSALSQARLVAGLRPDKYLRMAGAMRREGLTSTIGIALSARRCPGQAGLIDERGVLSYRELDGRADALAAALQQLSAGPPQTVGIMCRNHRGLIEALAAADRIGADALLLNTSFAGPALAEVVRRENPDIIVHDDEFTDSVDQALAEMPDTHRVVAWTDDPAAHAVTVETLIARHAGSRPDRSERTGRVILLTSGTTGTPKGARRAGGAGAADLAAVLSAIPWRAEEMTVVAAPMFHAWGYGQVSCATLLSCTMVMRRKFDAQATMELVDRYQATGLCVVPVMLDRMMALPREVRNRYSMRSLRFVSASGSRVRPDVVLGFMDQYGDVIYNSYNATEVGAISVAGPRDLREAPDTAGKPLSTVDVNILDDNRREVSTGEVGQIFARSATHFDSYTSGQNKEFHDGYMASGDVGYLDDAGRLFVVGRDDEMIVSGGENVYPIEVEKVLITHPAVDDASVLGVDDEQFGQRLVAFVVLVPGESVTEDALKQHVRDNLANFKVPRDIAVLDELPRNSAGKIFRPALRERIETLRQQKPVK